MVALTSICICLMLTCLFLVCRIEQLEEFVRAHRAGHE